MFNRKQNQNRRTWVDAALKDSSLVCQVLLQLRQDLSQPPPPPPSPPPPPPAFNIDWGVRQRRSRRAEARRFVVAPRSGVVIGGSSNSAANVEDSGRLNRTDASESKVILPELSGRRVAAKRSGKKRLVKLRDKEAMLEAKKEGRKERGITKTATKCVNDKESP